MEANEPNYLGSLYEVGSISIQRKNYFKRLYNMLPAHPHGIQFREKELQRSFKLQLTEI